MTRRDFSIWRLHVMAWWWHKETRAGTKAKRGVGVVVEWVP